MGGTRRGVLHVATTISDYNFMTGVSLDGRGVRGDPGLISVVINSPLLLYIGLLVFIYRVLGISIHKVLYFLLFELYNTSSSRVLEHLRAINSLLIGLNGLQLVNST